MYKVSGNRCLTRTLTQLDRSLVPGSVHFDGKVWKSSTAQFQISFSFALFIYKPTNANQVNDATLHFLVVLQENEKSCKCVSYS